jgi:hypothetical protein
MNGVPDDMQWIPLDLQKVCPAAHGRCPEMLTNTDKDQKCNERFLSYAYFQMCFAMVFH